ncbi:MAG: hypothetical protein ACHQ4G_07895 [Opitutales bacterium]
MSALRKHTPFRPETPPSTPNQQAWGQDVSWGRPVFKAPALRNLRPVFAHFPSTVIRFSQMPGDEVKA